MKNNIEENTFDTLDQHVKTMHRLLRQLESQSRIEYIKNMLPVLLCFQSPNSSSVQQKLKERLQNPVQPLSNQEMELINDLGKRTEKLYNEMYEDDFGSAAKSTGSFF